MASTESLYDILGVNKTATPDEIKKAYRKKALELHPDKATGDKTEAEEKFKKLVEAFSVLGDEEKRRQYDTLGTIGDLPPMPDINDILSSMFGGMGMPGMNFGGIGDPFGGIFGRMRGTQHQQHSETIQVEVSLEEVYKGCTKRVEYNIQDMCGGCRGVGTEDPKDIIKCMGCGGKGMITQMINPVMMTSTTCGSCGGQGKMIKQGKECRTCKGNKTVQNARVLELKLPKGVHQGFAQKVDGKASWDRNSGQYADLVVAFNLQNPDPKNIAIDEYHNVFVTLVVKLEEVLCGFTRSLNIFGHPLVVKSSGFVNPTKEYTFQGMGLPKFRKSTPGDLVIKLVVNWDANDSTRIAKYLDVFGKIFKYTPNTETPPGDVLELK
jgi:DnaJ-class molecular chaperone